jgi:hypothetical protein
MTFGKEIILIASSEEIVHFDFPLSKISSRMNKYLNIYHENPIHCFTYSVEKFTGVKQICNPKTWTTKNSKYPNFCAEKDPKIYSQIFSDDTPADRADVPEYGGGDNL